MEKNMESLLNKVYEMIGRDREKYGKWCDREIEFLVKIIQRIKRNPADLKCAFIDICDKMEPKIIESVYEMIGRRDRDKYRRCDPLIKALIRDPNKMTLEDLRGEFEDICEAIDNPNWSTPGKYI